MDDYRLARRRELLEAAALVGAGADRIRTLDFPDQEASLHLAEISRLLSGLLTEFRPAAVVTHAYEGGHPDHDATAFAVRAACALQNPGNHETPVVLEMTSYHLGESGIEVGRFLPGSPPGTPVLLSEQECRLKRQLFACYRTQQETLRWFPIGSERFRPAPRADFTRSPHPGSLFYEGYPWGMSGERFRTLAAEAARELGIGGAP